MDAELHYYLRNSDRPIGTIANVTELQQADSDDPQRLATIDLALGLGELALNAGLMEVAEFYFQAALDTGLNNPRSYSGLSDSQRFQDESRDSQVTDQVIAARYQQALDIDSSDTLILLDYGEYWEAELADCDKIYPANQRTLIVADIKQKFELAFSQEPDRPEANLSMGLFYLFEGEDWQLGLECQRKAFALLPADTFIMEQSVKYAIVANDFVEAERLIGEMAQPIHYWGEPGYVTDLRERLMRKRRSEPYDACAED